MVFAMAIVRFPPVELADENGLLAVGGDCEVESLLLAYRSGVFPWPVFDDGPLTWFSPPRRAVLFFDKLKIPRSLRKERRRCSLSFSVDTCFDAVIEHCRSSANRAGQQGTWITDEIVAGYRNLHLAGYCHSVECTRDGRLVGGLYGVSIGAMFAGESMFYLEPNSSKLSLLYLIEYLQERGGTWIDCQQMTPLLASFGAEEIARPDFLELLERTLKLPISLFS